MEYNNNINYNNYNNYMINDFNDLNDLNELNDNNELNKNNQQTPQIQQKNKNTFTCDYCYKTYNIVAKVNSDIPQCYECLLFLNYGNMDVLNGKHGVSLKEYINNIVNGLINHDIPCSRLNDSGGCYICMFLLDIPIDNYDPSVDLNKSINDNKNNKPIKQTDNITNLDVQGVTLITDDRLKDIDFLTI